MPPKPPRLTPPKLTLTTRQTKQVTDLIDKLSRSVAAGDVGLLRKHTETLSTVLRVGPVKPAVEPKTIEIVVEKGGIRIGGKGGGKRPGTIFASGEVLIDRPKKPNKP